MSDDRICPECGTKVTHLYEQGDCMYSINILADDAKEEFDDHRNMGYTWYCTDKSCDAGTDGWFGDRPDCPPKADEIKWERHTEPPKGEIAELMKFMIMKNLDIPDEAIGKAVSAEIMKNLDTPDEAIE